MTDVHHDHRPRNQRRSSGQSRELVRLATLPRGNRGDELRVSLDEFEPEDGPLAQYLSIRVWYDDRGQHRPGKSGTTVRRGELREVITALVRAERILSGQETVAGGPPQAVTEDLPF